MIRPVGHFRYFVTMLHCRSTNILQFRHYRDILLLLWTLGLINGRKWETDQYRHLHSRQLTRQVISASTHIAICITTVDICPILTSLAKLPLPCTHASQIAFSVHRATDGCALRPIKILSTCNCCPPTSQSASVQASNKRAAVHASCDPYHEKCRQNCNYVDGYYSI